MKTDVDNSELKDLYNRWVASKGRYEMALAMDTEKEHVNNYEANYKALSKELHNALWAQGHRTKTQVDLVLTELKPKPVKLTIIQGGKQ
jgi:hypothetical protein